MRDVDDILRDYFRNTDMQKVPESLTRNIMEQIHAIPGEQSVKERHFEWWWAVVGIAIVASVYLSRTYIAVYELLKEPLASLFYPVAELLSAVVASLPENIIVLPTSAVFPAVILGIMIILLFDTVFGRRPQSI